MVTVGDRMYVIGGQPGILLFNSHCIPEVEIFMPGEEVQTVLIRNLALASVTAVVKNNDIYVIGGYDGRLQESKDILIFDTECMTVRESKICVGADSIGDGFLNYNSYCLLKLPHVTYMHEADSESESDSTTDSDS